MSGRYPLVTGSAAFYERTGSSTPAAFPPNLPGHGSAPRENSEYPESSQDSYDPVDVFFDWPLYEGGTTEETTMSVFSDNSSATSPDSALTTPSSAGNNHEADEDTLMPDYAPQDLHRIQVWPGIPDTPLPRSQTISIPPTTASAEGTSSSRPSRARCLPDSDKTSEVRKKGACLHCRIKRVACTADGVCNKCEIECLKWQGTTSTTPEAKAQAEALAQAHARKMCVRKSPIEIIGGSAIRWCWDSSLPPARDRSAGGHDSIFVFFSKAATSPYLEVKVCFTSNGREALGIEPGASPSEDEILRWAKEQMEAERNPSFESSIETLLLTFVQHDGLQNALSLEGKQIDSKSIRFAREQQAWMKKLLDMRCMWKVWRCRQFYIRRTLASPEMHNSSPRFQAIQDHLHRRAEHAISSLEKSVLGGIDRLLVPFSIKKEHQYLQSALNISMWVSMWQLILIYRQSLSQMLIDQPRYSAPVFIEGASENLKRSHFRTATEQLFHSVVVVYSELFRTRKTLESLQDPRPKGLENDNALKGVFKLAWEAHKSFCMLYSPLVSAQ
ncbi:hypothetical protein B0T25DRAFT_616842 [Lasiosphaeria hispida]|uniref:Uncharacterized protein n=1 Tax=Lasiosphaeria hispida TaxID=260671 RepID=A0AAJ0H6H5_9PEZI|nr:hypothetical protein B0T25DRAFT_616842 [Lasiosphaeria hispida]